MEINCTEVEKKILNKIAAAAKTTNIPCYLIGGFVRDKLLNRLSKDADIVCLGDGLVLAKAVAGSFNPPPKVSYFKTYGTAHFKIPEGLDLEFVSARKESYNQHSRNPQVQPGSVIDDQNRRDFTINALAISLNEKDFGQLIDPFDGVDDLKQQLIKTPLDPLQTFSDDPLRMMRAIRFATQMKFRIDPKTLGAAT